MGGGGMGFWGKLGSGLDRSQVPAPSCPADLWDGGCICVCVTLPRPGKDLVRGIVLVGQVGDSFRCGVHMYRPPGNSDLGRRMGIELSQIPLHPCFLSVPSFARGR